MENKLLSLCLILSLSLTCGLPVQAAQQERTQQRAAAARSVTVQGVVYYASPKESKPLAMASVTIPDLAIGAMSDHNGNFRLSNVPVGKVRIMASSLGYITADTVITVSAGMPALKIYLHEDNFKLEDVVVTAQAGKTGQSTASMISRTAMDHMQTSSLADLMQLLPGGLSSNPDLSSAQTFTLRSVGQLSAYSVPGAAESNALDMNSLGTAIIMDGSPVSNNANMQSIDMTIGNVYTGRPSSVGGGSVPGSGVDLRQISTDNIESVEIIRGIPSVEYGDLTSGAVIVNSKAGKEPLAVRFKTNPNVYQFSGNKGLSLGEKAGNLNIGADYAYNVNRPTESYKYYQRVTAKTLYSNVFLGGKWKSNTSLDFIYGKSTLKPNPDTKRSQISEGALDVGAILNTNGTFFIDKGWFKTVKYTLSGTYMDRHNFYQEIYSSAMRAFSMAEADGSVITNIPGSTVYDTQGNVISDWKGDPNAFATFLPDAYLGRYDIYGKEVNLFAKISTQFSGRIGPTNHRLLAGVDLKSDGNLGKGQVFDPSTPPKTYITGRSARPRQYKDIPFVTQFGAYAEENLTWAFLPGRNLNLQAGVRYDMVMDFKSIVAPRVNLAVDLLKDKMLTLRGGFGITAKAPTVAYLHPDRAYFDFAYYNGMTAEGAAAYEKFMLVHTRSYDTDNRDNLEIATNRKAEVGLESRIKGMSFSLTGYYEKMTNGYAMSSTLGSWNWIGIKDYVSSGTVSPSGLAALDLANTYGYMAGYMIPTNNVTDLSKGIEATLDFGRVRSLRTSFSLTGAYMQNTYYTNGVTFFNSGIGASGITDQFHVGIYEAGAEKTHLERFVTTLRATHNIPRIGLVMTLTAQVTWNDRSWQTFGNDSIPIQYMDVYDNGRVKTYDPLYFKKLLVRYDRDETNPEYIQYKNSMEAAIKTKLPTRYRTENMPPLLLININITKEFKDNLRVSFFANNMLMNYPVYKSKVDPSMVVRRNPQIYFGLEFSAMIK